MVSWGSKATNPCNGFPHVPSSTDEFRLCLTTLMELIKKKKKDTDLEPRVFNAYIFNKMLVRALIVRKFWTEKTSICASCLR